MRTIFVLIITLCFMPVASQAQLNVGIKAGFNSTQLTNSNEILVLDKQGIEAFSMRIKEAKYGIHLGAYLKGYIGKFFIQPEVSLNSNTTTYDFSTSLKDEILSESFQYLDVPLMLGFDFGILNLQAGPVGHVFIHSSSDLDNIPGIQEKWDDLSWGWQAGIGFDIWKFNLDLRYEGNLYRYGDHLTFFDDHYTLSNRPSRIITSLGFVF
ncbi:MAG: PorT family protein [Saprospiraceae bacterium]|nr:PorT family protein [Saprospiraceae bacterium]